MIKKLNALNQYSKLWLTSRFFFAWFFTWPIVVAYFSEQYSLVQLGIYLGAIAFASTIGEIPTGIFADKFGRKLSITIGYILRSLGVVLVIFGLSPIGVIIAGIIRGTGSAFLSGATDALIYEKISHEEYENINSLDVTIYQVGLLLSVLTGGFMFSYNQLLPFIVEALGGLLSLIPLLLIPHLANQEQSFTLRTGLLSLKRIITTKRAILFALCIAIYSFVQDIFLDLLLEKRMLELNITPSGRGLMISLTKVTFLVIFQALIMARLSTIRSKVMFAMIGGTVGLVGIGVTNTPLLFVLLYFVLNFFTVMRGAIQNPIIQKLASPTSRATDSSLYSMISTIPFLIGAGMVTGYLTHHSSRMLYILFGLLLMAVVLPLLLNTLKWYEDSSRNFDATSKK